MNFKVNIKVCRVCMKSEDGVSLLRDQDLQSKFVFTTRLTLKPGDCMPGIICPKCVMRLKVAYDFVQMAHASEKNLKAFLTKVSSDFQEVTKSSIAEASSPMIEDVDDILKLFENADDDNSMSNEAKDSTYIETKTEAKNRPIAKKFKPTLATEPSPSKVKLENNMHVRQSFKKETPTEFQAEDEGVIYYEEANFLDESENEESEKEQILYENKDSEKTETDSEHQQINGYLDEYNTMVAEQDTGSCTENLTTHFIYSNTTEDEQEEILEEHQEEPDTMVEEMAEEVVLEIYEDAEDMLPDHHTISADSNDHLELHEELEITEETLINAADEAHPVELMPCTDNSTETLDIVKQYKAPSPSKSPRASAMKTKKSAPISSNSSINARFFCVRCNRDFSTKTNLTRHMATHEGIKPYQCTQCNKSFSQNGSLKQHMYTHTGEKPFVCEVCHRGFTQYKSLVFHMRRHTGEKPFPCEHCGTFFRQKDGLKTHILKHHMSRQTEGDTEIHTCDICQKLLPTKYLLQVHMKKHINHHRTIYSSQPTSTMTTAENSLIDLLSEDDLLTEKTFISEELALNLDDVSSSTQVLDTMTANTAKTSRAKKFQCRKCYKCFAIKKNLLRHLTTHDVSASELFQCQICQVAFDTNYALRVHRVREHKETGINLNECEHCNITFKNFSELNEHNSSVHDAKIQNCSECPDLHFKTQKQLLEHIMEHESLINEVDT